MSKIKTATILELILPHYREPFFKELTRCFQGKLTIVVGKKSFGGTPVSVESTPELRRINTNNVFIQKKFAFQFPLPRNVWSDDIVVVDFNIRIVSYVWILLLRKLLRRPIILWGHGFSRRENSPSLFRKIRIFFANLADALILYSEQGKQSFIEAGIDEQKLFVANNAIDVRNIDQYLSNDDQQRHHLIYVGRLIPSKKIHLLLKAFANAATHLPEQTKLFIIGDGPERESLLQGVEEHVRSRVVFTGEITDEEQLAFYFSQSLLAVSPGTIGLFAIHSLAHKVPVLTSDNEAHGPEIELLVDGRNSCFFKANDANDLAEKLKHLVNTPQNLLEMGRIGHKDVVAKYSIQAMCHSFLEAFEYVSR